MQKWYAVRGLPELQRSDARVVHLPVQLVRASCTTPFPRRRCPVTHAQTLAFVESIIVVAHAIEAHPRHRHTLCSEPSHTPSHKSPM
eukprot:4517283-Prymnesium_polylepis.1